VIDMGESLLSAVGVKALLLGTAGKMTAPQWTAAREIDKRIGYLARDLVNGNLDDSAFAPVNYDAVLDALSQAPPLAKLSESFGAADHEAELAFMGQAARAYNYLRGRTPVSVIKTVTGSVNLPPSGYALNIFEDTLEVIDRPLSVFAIIQQNRLTSQLALDLMTVYPSLYSAIVGAIVLRIVREKGIHGDYEPEWERSLAVLLAVPGIDQGLRDQLQTPTQQAPAAPKGPAPANAKPSLLATPSQKLELSS
jgi:hypothetical protein